MKRKSLLIALLPILVIACLVVAVAKETGADGSKGGDGVQPNARIPIDIDDLCHEDCCGQSGGHVEADSEVGAVCHINEDDPDHDIQVAMFEACARGC